MIALILASLLALPAAHREAATLAGKHYSVDPDLLLAIAHIESSHTMNVTKKARGGIACGPTQRRAATAEICKRLRTDVVFAYMEGARTLRYFMSISGGSMESALRGYGCGHEGKKRGGKFVALKPARPMAKCNRFETRVLSRWKRMKGSVNS